MNLADPGDLRKFLSRYGLKPDKGLGQHFLCSSSVVGAIAKRLDGMRGLLEIGPGPGVLTQVLSQSADQMTAVELDSTMIQALAESAPKTRVVQGDALKVDLGELLRELPEPRGVVSNLPYYITGPLLERIDEQSPFWSVAVLMMQREVARKIVAKPGDSERGAISVNLQRQFKIAKLIDAPKGAFLPPPNVESQVLAFEPRPEALEHGHQFFQLTRTGFSQPRKTLANNLTPFRNLGKEAAAAKIVEAGLRPDVRPHQLTEDEWNALAALFLAV